MDNPLISYPCDLFLLQDKIRRLISKLGNPYVSYISTNDFEYDFVISYSAFKSSISNINYRDYFDIDLKSK